MLEQQLGVRSRRVKVVRTPIRDVLAKVPGHSLPMKAKHLGVSRVTIWQWWTDQHRPGWENCVRLEELTGVPAEDIFGRIVRD